MKGTTICSECGKAFEPRGTRDKYCPECKRSAYAAKKQERKRKGREGVVNELYFCDPPENIEKCLACTIPPEECHGTCYMPGRKKGRRV